MLGFIMVRWRASILSLGSGDRMPVLVGLNEVCQKMAESIQYNTVQYNTKQYNTIQYNTIQYNTIQYNTMPFQKF